MMSATTISLTYNNRELHTKMNICSTYVESDLKNIRPALSKYIACQWYNEYNVKQFWLLDR